MDVGANHPVRMKIINTDNIRIRTDEGLEKEGRWIGIEITELLDKKLTIWRIYAPTKLKERIKWIEELGEELKKARDVKQ